MVALGMVVLGTVGVSVPLLSEPPHVTHTVNLITNNTCFDSYKAFGSTITCLLPTTVPVLQHELLADGQPASSA
jgi:hypothetical protein